MLLYKAWLETRWRFAFWLLCTAGLMFLPKFLNAPPKAAWVLFQLQSVVMGCFAAVYLAGSGVNTQTLYSGTSGFHPSMLFTLSLPVSRRQLLLARAGLGALETCLLVLLNEWITLSFSPVATGVFDALRFGIRTVVCTMAVYALSVLAACVLDEMWQFTGVTLALLTLWIIQSRSSAVAQLSPLRGMSLLSVPITDHLPWPSILASAVMAAVLMCLSVIAVQRKHY